MLFINDKEVNIQKSLVLKAFHQINSVQAFLSLGLPIKKYTTPGNNSSTDMTKFLNKQEGQKNGNVAFEIDISHPKRIQRALGLKALDCYPILWCF
jgi:hypothetical protein|tara:strand:- start:314 stop:601 length:288 start_codon:yes stop_codon:yes gene_type:complete